MGAAELSQQDLGVSRAVTEGNEGAAPVRGLSLIKNTIRARATASRILEERALSSWQRVGRNGKCVCVHTHTSAGSPLFLFVSRSRRRHTASDLLIARCTWRELMHSRRHRFGMSLRVHVEDGDTHSPENSCPLVPLAVIFSKAVDFVAHLVLDELAENEHARPRSP